jgi:PhzF family phenazine biosynthesis protein
MRLKMFRVDAFTDQVFHGNPAGVVPLKAWLADGLMQEIAMENNLPETAFFVPEGKAFALRWFTPAAEVPLCGHATLATAFVILTLTEPSRKQVVFHTQSGDLTVLHKGDLLTMDFPRYQTLRCDEPEHLAEGLGIRPAEVRKTREDSNYYAIFESADAVRSMAPNLEVLRRLHPHQTAVSAPGEAEDFVSRFFAPGIGIPEDPVTGTPGPAGVPARRRTGLRGRPGQGQGADLRAGGALAEGVDPRLNPGPPVGIQWTGGSGGADIRRTSSTIGAKNIVADRYEVVDTVFGRQEAEVLQSYLRAQDIDCELSQEGAGPAIGITVDGLGEVQVLVPSRQRDRALEAIARYRNAEP